MRNINKKKTRNIDKLCPTISLFDNNEKLSNNIDLHETKIQLIFQKTEHRFVSCDITNKK